MKLRTRRANHLGFLAAAALTTLAVTAALATARADDGNDRRGNQQGDGRGDAHDDFRVFAAEAARIKRGFEIVPKGVNLTLTGRNLALVGLGSYIVNAQGGCNDCHTHPNYAPGGDPFQGQPEMINAVQYMTGGRLFGPSLASPNITPDNAGRPHGLTRAQFIETMRTGHNPQDPAGQILQVMPWPVYGKMIDRDLSAVYEFLRSIPPLPDNPNPGP